MTQFGEKCKKIFFALLNIVGFIVAFIVEFNLTMLKTLTATNLDTLALIHSHFKIFFVQKKILGCEKIVHIGIAYSSS